MQDLPKITIDATVLRLLSQPIGEKFILAGKNAASSDMTVTSGIDLLKSLGGLGYRIVIPAGVAYELAHVMADGTNVEDYFPSKDRFPLPKSTINFIEQAGRGIHPNISIEHEARDMASCRTQLGARLMKFSHDVSDVHAQAARDSMIRNGGGKHKVLDTNYARKLRGLALDFNDYLKERGDVSSAIIGAMVATDPKLMVWSENSDLRKAASAAGADVINSGGVIAALEKAGLNAHLGLSSTAALYDSLCENDPNFKGATPPNTDRATADGDGPQSRPFRASLDLARARIAQQPQQQKPEYDAGKMVTQYVARTGGLSAKELIARQQAALKNRQNGHGNNGKC